MGGVEAWPPLFRNFAIVGKFADMSQLLLARTWLSCIKTYPTNALVGQNQLGAPNIYCSQSVHLKQTGTEAEFMFKASKLFQA